MCIRDREKAQPGQQVAIIGGGLVGCETASYLAARDHRVIILEMQEELACGQSPSPVSYTHLDVYKRQVVACGQVRGSLAADQAAADNGYLLSGLGLLLEYIPGGNSLL